MELGDGVAGVHTLVKEAIGTKRETTKYGFICEGVNYGQWFLQDQGVCAWRIGRHAAPIKRQDDGLHLRLGNVEIKKVLSDYPVQVVCFVDTVPGKNHAVWQSSTVEGVLWVARGQIRTQEVTGWKIRREIVRHNEVGGVTNGMFRVGVAIRQGSTRWRWKPKERFVPNVLCQVLDPCQSGRKVEPPNEEKGPVVNTAIGLLDWGQRFGFVQAPTVYSKDWWAKRRLTNRELASALDLPGSVTTRTSANSLNWLAKATVPGKLVSYVLQGLRNTTDKQGTRAVGTASEGQKREAEKASVATPRPKRRKVDTAEVAGCTGWSVVDLCDKLEGGKTTISAKSTKSDDAEVPQHLWDQRVILGIAWLKAKLIRSQNLDLELFKVRRAMRLLRGQLLRVWKRRVEVEFWRWFEEECSAVGRERTEVLKDGIRAIGHAKSCSWWNWTGGSSVFFWRWKKEFQQEARTGGQVFWDKGPPRYFQPQPPYNEEATRIKVKAKLDNVIAKGYVSKVEPSALKSLMFMFDVPKGDEDIRMVYDGSKSGLNDALWAPWFALPTVDAMVRTLEPGYWLGDNDYGEMFLNFPLARELRPYCGIDISQIYPEEAKNSQKLLTAMWNRNAMGLKPSPYNSIQGGLRVKRDMLGDRRNPQNPFRWARIIENYPGSDNYDPTKPWIRKVREDGKTAADLHKYVDDLRLSAPTEEETWRASSQVAKTASEKGLQDAARKRRRPSQKPGAWAGAIVATTNGRVTRGVTQERWEKAKSKIRWLGYYAGCRVPRE